MKKQEKMTLKDKAIREGDYCDSEEDKVYRQQDVKQFIKDILDEFDYSTMMPDGYWDEGFQACINQFKQLIKQKSGFKK